MKKNIVLALALVAIFAGCGDSNKNYTSQVSSTNEVTAKDSVASVSEVAKPTQESVATEVKDVAKEGVAVADGVVEDAKDVATDVVADVAGKVDEVVASATTAVDVAATTKACVGCHGVDGSKNTMVSGGGIPNTLSKAELKSSLEGYATGSLNKFGKGAMMVGFAKSLTAEQIDAISEAWGK